MASGSNPFPKYSKQWIITDKTAVEAGYVNDPDDAGGETNHGITKRVADANKADLVRLFKWDGTMRNLSKEMAFFIYEKDYWNKLFLDEVAKRCPFIADKMFDIGINIGPGKAAEWFQNYLNANNRKGKLWPNMKVDRAIGKWTVGAFDAFLKARGNKPARWSMLKALLCQQGSHYQAITINDDDESNETFIFGWMERLDHNLVEYYQALKAS